MVIDINAGEESNPKAMARGFQQKHGLTYPILPDESGKVTQAYRVQGFPTNVIMDREGKLRYIEPGFNAEAINKALQQLLTP